MPQTRREQRDRERIRRAAARAAADAGASSPAMAAALAQIGAAFDRAAVLNGQKMRVERLLHLGPHHPEVRARFGARAQLLHGRSLAAALTLVEQWWRAERKAFQIASALGYGNRLSLDVLRELRLVLRWLHAKHMEGEFAGIIAALGAPPTAAAAE